MERADTGVALSKALRRLSKGLGSVLHAYIVAFRWHVPLASTVELMNSTKLTDSERQHTCYAKGCTVSVHSHMLMCSPHWYMVPRLIQTAIWRYRSRHDSEQCVDKKPAPEYLDALKAAIVAVAEREKRMKESA